MSTVMNVMNVMNVMTPDPPPARGFVVNSTGTYVAKLGGNLSIDLRAAFHAMPIVPVGSGAGPVHVKGLEGEEPIGVNPKLRPTRRTRTQRAATAATPNAAVAGIVKRRRTGFSNSFTVIMCIAPGVHPNLKVFSNGSIQGTGLKNPRDFYVALEILRRIFVARPHVFTGRLFEDPSEFQVRICMLNCNTRLPFPISLGRFVEVLDRRGVPCIFAPDQYPSAKCYHYRDGKRSVASVSSQSMGVTGIPLPSHGYEHIETLVTILEEERDEVGLEEILRGGDEDNDDEALDPNPDDPDDGAADDFSRFLAEAP